MNSVNVSKVIKLIDSLSFEAKDFFILALNSITDNDNELIVNHKRTNVKSSIDYLNRKIISELLSKKLIKRTGESSDIVSVVTIDLRLYRIIAESGAFNIKVEVPDYVL